MSTEKSPFGELLTKPPSSHARGARKGNTRWNLIRDNFEISTWLAMGAGIQLLLFASPISTWFAALPALAVLGFKSLRTVLIWKKFLRNERMEVVHRGPNFYGIPEGASTADGGRAGFAALPGSEEVCVAMVTSQSHHPFGYFAPRYQFDSLVSSMIEDLEKNAATNGFLGATSWVNTSDYTSNNTMMTQMYFRSKRDEQKFHASHAHALGAKWWGGIMRGGIDYIGIYQENYVSGKGQWDNFTGNARPQMFDATNFLVEDDEGMKSWRGPHKELMTKVDHFGTRRRLYKQPMTTGEDEEIVTSLQE